MSDRFGIDWQHEYAIAEWEAERTYKPERGVPLEAVKGVRKRYVRAEVFRELATGNRSDNGKGKTKKRHGLTFELRSEDAPTPFVEPDERMRVVLDALDAAGLTEFESEVLSRSLAGWLGKDMAALFGFSPAWIGIVKRRGMKKLRAELVKSGAAKRVRPYTTREML